MLCIEVKSRRGTLRPEQKLFLDAMGSLGAITLVARSLPDVAERLSAEPHTPHKESLPGHDELPCHTACMEPCDTPDIVHDDSE
jgi:hypothetical protein